ncbi:MAG TPA: phage baseplate assembly protein [Acetobacteraceae bacterium]|nr:phage baseplate assembly protein [Acetobacteraceae bacterium]
MTTSLEATVAMLARQVVMLERQVSALMLRRGAPFALARTTLAVNDTGPVQTVQAQLDALSTRDNIPVLYGFGVTGSPPMGTDLHLAFLDGDRAKSLAIAGGRFRRVECPGRRMARLHCDPRSLGRGQDDRSVSHAKVAVCDTSRAFFRSADPTELALRPNIEIGVLLSAPASAASIRDRIQPLTHSGVLFQAAL